MTYIYQKPNWPQFDWNLVKISELLAHIRYLQGRFIGRMESIGFNQSQECFLQSLTQEVVKSSEIEGEILDGTLVRSSVARRLGIEIAAVSKSDRHIDGVVDMMLDATQKFYEPLTKERLFKWHKDLFPDGQSGFSKIVTGDWRKSSVEVVYGAAGREKVHYEAPPADQVDREVALFLEWFNRIDNLDLVLKSTIAHLWFVTIHPFEDGNGRISRAIADLMLARSENCPRRFYSLSSQIQKERKSYYSILEQTQKGNLDITDWIEWILGCFGRSIEQASHSLEVVLLKTHFWQDHDPSSFNSRQKKIINILLEGMEGNLTSSKWSKITKCSQDTAHRDILELIQKGILIKNQAGGRSTSYSLILTKWNENCSFDFIV
jgi:Fic family protein